MELFKLLCTAHFDLILIQCSAKHTELPSIHPVGPFDNLIQIKISIISSRMDVQRFGDTSVRRRLWVWQS
jgi:hypothetical protein